MKSQFAHGSHSCRQNGSTSNRRDFGVIVPNSRDRNQAIILAALLFAPELIGPHVASISPSDFGPTRWKNIARMALFHVIGMGAADISTIRRMLVSVGHESPYVVSLELRNFKQLGSVLNQNDVDRSVAALRFGATV